MGGETQIVDITFAVDIVKGNQSCGEVCGTTMVPNAGVDIGATKTLPIPTFEALNGHN